MKKIILLLLLIPINLSAFSEYQDEKFEDNNLIWEEKEFCYSETEVVEYLEKDDFRFELYDLTDYKISYGDWKKDFNGFENYEEREKYYYQVIEPIRYLHFTQFKSPDNKFMLNELIVMYGLNDLDYEIICNGCYGDENIKNGVYYNENFYIENDGELIIDLGDYYPLYSIYVKMYFSNFEHGENAFRLETSMDQTNKFTWTYSRNWYGGGPLEYFLSDFNLSSSNLANPSYSEPIESETLRSANKFIKSYVEKEYREVIYSYKNYEFEITEVEKEESDYCRTLYRYKEKEIIEENAHFNLVQEKRTKKKDKPELFVNKPLKIEPINLTEDEDISKLGKTEWIQLEQKKTNYLWYWFVPPIFWSALRTNAKN